MSARHHYTWPKAPAPSFMAHCFGLAAMEHGVAPMGRGRDAEESPETGEMVAS